ncbi:hypothetical protein EDB19DRAFT_1692683 [Suillus lakei]|nr:hypothetical protein EDB19DRAFT_1692683 [Suillus lakei]
MSNQAAVSESAVVSQSAMSNLLPVNFVGTTMAGVQNEDGRFRVYYQSKDYQIYEMTLNNPKSTDYTLLKLTTPALPAARINTPIAAVAWNNLQEIRVYYLTVTSQVQEIIYGREKVWMKGSGPLGTAVDSSTCLYAQHNHGDPFLRVGFQSSTAPQTITEACYMQGHGWKTRVL